MTARKPIEGIIAMLVTPFDDQYRLDEGALRAEVNWCVAQGANGIVATPSIGEFAHLTKEERWRCFEVCLDQAQKHPGLITVAMTSGPTTLEALEHTEVAGKMGYDAALLIPPYYWRCGEEEVFRHYEMVAKANYLPLIVYHNPALSKFHMTPRFFGRLSFIPGIVAIKEVSTDLQHLEALFDAVAERLTVLQTFRAFFTGLLLGAVGGFINVFAVPACVRIAEGVKKGDLPRAVEIQRRLNRCFPRGGEETVGHLGTTKVTASVVTGIEMGPPRPPYIAPPEAEEQLRKRLPDLLAVL
jgi:dihydrodipicolinate synthase/N-acetylneuraminate lyase